MRRNKICEPIVIRGVTYPDPDRAAAAQGVGRDAVIAARREGKLETVGLRRRYRDFEINGRRFATLKTAAEFYGVCEGRIEQAVRSGNTATLGTRKRPHEMQIRIRGQLYPDAGAAAKACGVGRSAVYAAIYRGELDRLGLPPRHAINNARVFSAGGHSWPSEAAACRDLGLRPDFVCRMRQRNSEPMRARLMAALMQFTAARDALARKRRLAEMDQIGRDAA
jgi:hypothetical protein